MFTDENTDGQSASSPYDLPTDSRCILGGGQMPKGTAIFRGRGRARNQLIKNIIISYAKLMIYAFLKYYITDTYYNQFKLQAAYFAQRSGLDIEGLCVRMAVRIPMAGGLFSEFEGLVVWRTCRRTSSISS